uniref:Uncharacterized protein n=1 Tax=Arundo donax TaxID=35708 RepID=A0A0A9H6T8_ARUDO
MGIQLAASETGTTVATFCTFRASPRYRQTTYPPRSSIRTAFGTSSPWPNRCRTPRALS